MFPKSADRRLVNRVALNVPILVWGARDHQNLNGFTRDVSSTGVFFVVPSWPHASEMIEFLLLLPPSATSLDYEVGLSCRGRAIRIEEPRPDGSIGVAAEIEDFRLRTMRLDPPPWVSAREFWAGLRTLFRSGLQQLRSVRVALGRIRNPEAALPPTPGD